MGPSPESRPPPHTMCAIGKYASVTHRVAKSIQVPNLTRSARDPAMSATVMIAKVDWNATPTQAGTPKSSTAAPSKVPIRPNCSNGFARIPAIGCPP